MRFQKMCALTNDTIGANYLASDVGRQCRSLVELLGKIGFYNHKDRTLCVGDLVERWRKYAVSSRLLNDSVLGPELAHTNTLSRKPCFMITTKTLNHWRTG